MEWVTQISNSLSDRAFEKREAAAKAAADAAANADMAQPVALDAESGGGSKEPLKPKKEVRTIAVKVYIAVSCRTGCREIAAMLINGCLCCWCCMVYAGAKYFSKHCRVAVCVD